MWGDLIPLRNYVMLCYPWWVAIYTFPITWKTKKTIYRLIWSVAKSFPINGDSFHRKPSLIAKPSLIVYSSSRLLFETVFISKQITENRFGTLLEISDKFITKFNVFSYNILQFSLKTVWKISKPSCMTLKQWLGSFAWKVIVCSKTVRDELLEKEKDMKIKRVSTPTKTVWGDFFCKKTLHGGINVFG